MKFVTIISFKSKLGVDWCWLSAGSTVIFRHVLIFNFIVSPVLDILQTLKEQVHFPGSITGLCEGNHQQFYLIIVILAHPTKSHFTLTILKAGFKLSAMKGNILLAVIDKRRGITFRFQTLHCNSALLHWQSFSSLTTNPLLSQPVYSLRLAQLPL